MAQLSIIGVIVLCFVIGALCGRYRLGSRQEVLRAFDSFSSNSHRQCFDHKLRFTFLAAK
jgi:hypothetical protein